MTTVSVRLFGAFRQFGPENSIDVCVPADARVADLRASVGQFYADNTNALALLKASAFATDQSVLDDDEGLPHNQPLSILPPVCGG